MKRLLSVVLVVLSMFAMCSCRSTHYPNTSLRAGNHTCKTGIKFNGFSRSYRLYVPPFDSDVELPLVVVLHGAFSTDKKIERETGFSDLAEREGCYVVYPNGIGIFGFLQHWNAGHCCGKAAKDKVDDVAYLDAVIDDVSAICPINQSRIYMVGHSNGGMMVYRYVAERAERLTAAAVVAGAINSKSSQEEWCLTEPARPIPMLIMHGMLDPSIPLQGGKSGDRSDDIDFASVYEAHAFWQQSNAGKAPVDLILMEGWGHDWPGLYYTSREHGIDSMQDYDAAEVIWDFFGESAQRE